MKQKLSPLLIATKQDVFHINQVVAMNTFLWHTIMTVMVFSLNHYKNRHATSIVTAWTKINDCLTLSGSKPTTWIMDNECSQELKKTLDKETIQWQLVPPYSHCANAAEHAIQTFKAHFKAGLATLDPNYPISEWDCLLPQAELTLNLLQSACVNPKLSSYAYLFGQFDFNKMPLVPPGTKILAHDKPDI